MSDLEITVPGNVLRFEIAAYAALMVDTASAAMQAWATDSSDQNYDVINFVNALFILAFVFLVGLAARKRKNWARMVLLAALLLAIVSLVSGLSTDGVELTTGFNIVSAALMSYGLHRSFTGNARGWFTE